MNRWIDLAGVVNMRDVGGLPTTSGNPLAPGRLIRSDALQDLTPEDVRQLVEVVGVTDVVDLRSHLELHVSGDGPLRATALRHHHHSFFPDPDPQGEPPAFLGKRDTTARRERIKNADRSFWSQHYRGYLTTRPDSVSAALSVIATAAGGTIVHCAAGKDRTGTVVALALAVAGVPPEVIVEDYVLTAERIDRIVARISAREPYFIEDTPEERLHQTPRAESMESLLEMLEKDFGGAEGWLRAHDWSDAEVSGLREKLLGESAPAR